MSQSRVLTVNKTLRWVERLLLLCGLIAISIWAASYAGAAIFQSWQDFAFQCRLQGGTATFLHYVVDRGKRLAAAEEAWCGLGTEPSSLTPPAVPRTHVERRIANDSLVGRLVIPRLHLGEIVREGD